VYADLTLGTIKESSPSPVQLHALPLPGGSAMLSLPAGQNFQAFLLQEGKGKCERVWPGTHPTAGLPV